ncbi:hypothetical protein AcV7_005372 [Taiwanofungus camphoratus]|nr:hypothetical protein AcV7_005372 [Antrodia cinnamomea]
MTRQLSSAGARSSCSPSFSLWLQPLLDGNGVSRSEREGEGGERTGGGDDDDDDDEINISIPQQANLCQDAVLPEERSEGSGRNQVVLGVYIVDTR